MVGAGGAGFPSHLKLKAAVDTVIGNGIECEPLLSQDRAVMVHRPETVIKGLSLLAEVVGARRKIIVLKKKYADAMRALEPFCDECEIILTPDYYPAGDEVEIVKFLSGETVPEAGLPLDVGVVVNNVETLTNIARACEGIPVTRRFVTVCGEVKKPTVLSVPLGTKISDIVDRCGGATTDNPVYYTGGPMMGEIAGADSPALKTTTGIFALPQEHELVRARSLRMEYILRQAQSACTSCRLCTDACPRYLLGHAIEPHRVMRAIGLTQDIFKRELTSALLCSECGVCEYACPMRLSPRRIYRQIKEYLAAEGIEYPRRMTRLSDHPMRESRRIPGGRLLERLGLKRYEVRMDYDDSGWSPQEVALPLKQHIGLPAQPVVSPGDRVIEGEVIAEIPPGAVSARLHASIDGKVTAVDDDKIIIGAV